MRSWSAMVVPFVRWWGGACRRRGSGPLPARDDEADGLRDQRERGRAGVGGAEALLGVRTGAAHARQEVGRRGGGGQGDAGGPGPGGREVGAALDLGPEG